MIAPRGYWSNKCRELEKSLVELERDNQMLKDALSRIVHPNHHGDPTPREAAFIRDIARDALNGIATKGDPQ